MGHATKDRALNFQDETQNNLNFGWFFAVTAIILAFFQVVLTINFAYKVRKDFTTKDEAGRKKLFPHRRSPPKLTKGYKITNTFTLMSIIWANVYNTGQVIKYGAINSTECTAWVDVQGSGTIISKLFFYLTLLARLYIIYKDSAYCYSLKCIRCFAALLVTYNFWIALMIIIFFHGFYRSFGNGTAYPNYCGDGTPSPTMPFNVTPSPTRDEQDFAIGYALAAGGMVFQDIAVTTSFYWAFKLPLDKARKVINSQLKGNKNVLRKIMYASQKTKVLLLVSTISQLTISIFAIVTSLTVFVLIDPIISSIVLMLMTSYYPDDIYYQKFCGLAIKCCDRRGDSLLEKSIITRNTSLKEHIHIASTSSNAGNTAPGTPNSNNNNNNTNENTELAVIKDNNNNNHDFDESIDTMSQLRVITERLGVKYFKKGLIGDGYNKFVDQEYDDNNNKLQQIEEKEEKEIVENVNDQQLNKIEEDTEVTFREIGQQEKQKENQQKLDEELDKALGNTPDTIVEALSKETSTPL